MIDKSVIETNPDNAVDSHYNPIAWGILFFSMWMTLASVESHIGLHDSIKLVLLVLSAVMWLSIPFSWISDLLLTKTAKNIILPVVFQLTIFGYTLGWLTSMSQLRLEDLSIAVYWGFIWFITFTVVLVARFKQGLIRLGISVVYLIFFIIATVTNGISTSWPLGFIFIAVALASLCPLRLRKVPLI